MMYKNAGIKSKKEAAQRLINGEVFYFAGVEIKFDSERGDPFLLGEVRLADSWQYYTAWGVKTEWYEDLGEGRLCWVWDDEEERGRIVALVVQYVAPHDYRFLTKRGARWKYAEPLTEAEWLKYGGGEK